MDRNRTNPLLGWLFHQEKDPSFIFNEEPHIYLLAGKRLWSPSGVFRQVGYSISDFFRPEHRIRGQYVHSACHYLDEGDLDWASLKDHPYQVEGYVRAWQAFVKETNFIPRLIEVHTYHRDLLYGVTPDREGLIFSGDPAIVEIKSGTMRWWTKYQTASQALAVQSWEQSPTPRRRFGVELSIDGKYRMEEFTDPDDYNGWGDALRTCQRLGEPPTKLQEEPLTSL